MSETYFQFHKPKVAPKYQRMNMSFIIITNVSTLYIDVPLTLDKNMNLLNNARDTHPAPTQGILQYIVKRRRLIVGNTTLSLLIFYGLTVTR